MENSISVTAIVIFVLLLNSCNYSENEIFDEVPHQLESKRIERIDPFEDERLIQILADYSNNRVNNNGRVLNFDFGDVLMDEALRAINEEDSIVRYSLLIKDTSSITFDNIIFKDHKGNITAYIFRYIPDIDWLIMKNGEFDLFDFSGRIEAYDLSWTLLDLAIFENGSGIQSPLSPRLNGRIKCSDNDGGPSGGSGGGSGDSSGSGGSGGPSGGSGTTGGGTPCEWEASMINPGGIVIICNGQYYFFRTLCDGGGSGTPTDTNGPIGVLNPEETVELIPEILEYLVQQNPAALIENCDEIEAWQELAQLEIEESIKNKINNLHENNEGIFGDWEIQTLNEAGGTILNLDLFEVNVSELPINPETGTQFNASEFYDYFRSNMNDFVAPIEFSPYCVLSSDLCNQETSLWNSNDPTGAIVYIDILGNDGVVVCSEYTDQYWRFTTLEAPIAWSHPVSGTREFGYSENPDGSISIYTRAVDRISSNFQELFISSLIRSDPYEIADQNWITFQENLSNFINDNGGDSEVQEPVTNRPDWVKVKEVLLGERPLSDIGCE